MKGMVTMKRSQDQWKLGFLGFLGVPGIMGILTGNYVQIPMIFFLFFFLYFFKDKPMVK